MKKLIISLTFLIIVSLVSAKAFVSLFGYQAIEKLKSEIEQEASVSYSWLSSDFSGNLTLHDVSITPFRLKQTYSAEELSIGYGSLPAITFGLLDLKDASRKGIQSINIKNARTPIDGRGLMEWLALEYDPAFEVPLGIHRCGEKTALQSADWNKMGLSEFRADIRLNIDEMLEETRISIESNLMELGDLNANIQLVSSSLPYHFKDLSVLGLKLSALEIEHIEKGFLRRLSNFCTSVNGDDRANFANRAAESWQASMASVGLLADASIEQFYQDYLTLGGKIQIAFSPAKPVQLSEANTWLDRSISDHLGLSLSLNDSNISEPSLFLQGEYYRPKPVVVEVKAPEPKKIEKSFQEITWEELTGLEQSMIRIELPGDKIIEGTLVEVSKYGLSIAQTIQGGQFVHHPKKSDVQLIQVWR